MKFTSEQSEANLTQIMMDVIVLDDLEMSKEVLRFAEQYVLKTFKLSVSLPLKAEQIVAIGQVSLVQLIRVRTNTQFRIKIFNALVDQNEIGNWNGDAWSGWAPQMIDYLLMKDPMAMSPTQFDALLAWANDKLRARCLEFMQTAISRGDKRVQN